MESGGPQSRGGGAAPQVGPGVPPLSCPSSGSSSSPIPCPVLGERPRWGHKPVTEPGRSLCGNLPPPPSSPGLLVPSDRDRKVPVQCFPWM